MYVISYNNTLAIVSILQRPVLHQVQMGRRLPVGQGQNLGEDAVHSAQGTAQLCPQAGRQGQGTETGHQQGEMSTRDEEQDSSHHSIRENTGRKQTSLVKKIIIHGSGFSPAATHYFIP